MVVDESLFKIRKEHRIIVRGKKPIVSIVLTGKDIKAIEKDVAMKERLYKRRRTRGVEWSNNEECKLYMREKAERFRNKYIPKDRRCKNCGVLKLKSNSWVVMPKKGVVICRSCYNSNLYWDKKKIKENKTMKKIVKINVEDVFKERIRYEINGFKLAQLREVIGMAQTLFAKKAGWSRGYQNNIERDAYETLSKESVVKMLNIFKEAKIPLGKLNSLLRME